MFVPRLFKLSVVGLGRVADSMLTCSKLTLPERANVVVLNEEGQIEGALVGAMLPPELTEMFEFPGAVEGGREVAESVPPTAISESALTGR